MFLVCFYVLQRYIRDIQVTKLYLNGYIYLAYTDKYTKKVSVFGADANKLSASSYFSCTKTVHYAAGICHDIIF